MYRDVLGFSITPFMQRVMNINGFFASIMRTGKKAEGGKDTLPPGVPIPVLPVDYLKDRPASWIGGEGSYVCPVDSDWGLWFNFTMNNPATTAVLSSVKGMNPITGQRVGGYDLEGYQDECPVHKKPFSKGRLCTECGFKWPAQNYISLPNKFWIDGFRTPDGNVRQFYFTEEMAKSIPEQVIGKEDCVPAFGFCFYHSKEQPKYEEGKHVKNEFPADCFSRGSFLIGSSRGFGSMGIGMGYLDSSMERSYVDPGVFCGTMSYGDDEVKSSGTVRGMSLGSSLDSSVSSASCYFAAPAAGSVPDSAPAKINFTATNSAGGFLSSETEKKKKKLVGDYVKSASKRARLADMIQPLRLRRDYVGADVEKTLEMSEALREASGGMKEATPIRKSAEVGIGAGAKIKQAFDKSTLSVEDWEKKPAGVVRLYFVFQEEFERYAAAGFNSLEGNASGYLEGLPVGGAHE